MGFLLENLLLGAVDLCDFLASFALICLISPKAVYLQDGMLRTAVLLGSLKN